VSRAGPEVRAFVALELDEASRAALRHIQDELRAAGGDVKLTAPQNLHLTLHFLGNVPRERLPDLEEGLKRACEGHAPFALGLSGAGAFPSLRRPKIVWAGCAGDLGPLLSLAGSVGREMTDCGYPADKPFKPHLTLGRSKSDAGARELTPLLERLQGEAISSCPVESVVLFQSDLRPQGPIYAPLARFPLTG
jgi:2'-5' RNA ligase